MLSVNAKRRRPVADKLAGKRKKRLRGEVVDIEPAMVGRARAAEIDNTVATRVDRR